MRTKENKIESVTYYYTIKCVFWYYKQQNKNFIENLVRVINLITNYSSFMEWKWKQV